LVLEDTKHKLEEASFFLGKVKSCLDDLIVLSYYLSAFVSAGRSVTWSMQKEFEDNSTYKNWYKEKREQMKNDNIITIFRDLRNITVKEGKLKFNKRLNVSINEEISRSESVGIKVIRKGKVIRESPPQELPSKSGSESVDKVSKPNRVEVLLDSAPDEEGIRLCEQYLNKLVTGKDYYSNYIFDNRLGHQKQIAWRRNKVQELMIQGCSQIQIANTLKVSEGTISNDVIYLRDKARQNMQTHLQDRLPEEYENCMAGINQVLKMSWEIATKGQSSNDSSSSNSNSNSDSDRTLSSTVDDRTRLQALALANDCYKYKMDLVTNGVVITDAIKFVQQKKQELNRMNSDKVVSGEGEEEGKRSKEEEKEEALDSDNAELDNTKNKVF
jgi:hypothetical protein